MKPALITKDRSYVNKSGRSERRVLDIGTHIKVTWFGDEETRPKDEPGVRYAATRLGKTYYGKKSGTAESALYLSAFASWAKRELPESEAAPYQ